MRTARSTLALSFLVACAGAPATAQDTDIDKLYAMVQQARAELQALRVQAGITEQRQSEEGGEHREGREGRERRGEHEGREGRERRGEHDEGREGRGEHGEGGEDAGNRPSDPALRPLYNQLLLLSREIQLLSSGLRR